MPDSDGDAVTIIGDAMIEVFGSRAEAVAERQFHAASCLAGPVTGSWLSIITRIELRVSSSAYRDDPVAEANAAEPGNIVRPRVPDHGKSGLRASRQHTLE